MIDIYAPEVQMYGNWQIFWEENEKKIAKYYLEEWLKIVTHQLAADNIIVFHNVWIERIPRTDMGVDGYGTLALKLYTKKLTADA